MWKDGRYQCDGIAAPPYLISTGPDGKMRWWTKRSDIPASHRDIRVSTEDETAVMDGILAADGDNALFNNDLDERIQALLSI